MKEDNASEHINFRIKPDAKALILKAADYKGINLSKFICSAAEKAASSVIQQMGKKKDKVAPTVREKKEKAVLTVRASGKKVAVIKPLPKVKATKKAEVEAPKATKPAKSTKVVKATKVTKAKKARALAMAD